MLLFGSDFHLGIPNHSSSLEREKRIVRWLENEGPKADHIFLVGDLFDYWFEYKHFVPKYHVRFLGAIAALNDAGKDIHIFSGNHDVWMFDYFEKELGARVHHQPFYFESEGKSFYIAHGDGLGPGDHGYKFIRRIFWNPVCQWFYTRLHPDFGFRMATFFSRSSRNAQDHEAVKYMGDEKESLFQHSVNQQQLQRTDYYIYGHRHFPIIRELPNHGQMVVLGDWLQHFSYARFHQGQMELITGYQ